MTTEGSRRLAIEYSNKAVEYSRHWEPIIAPMALPLLDELPLGAARRILDVGSGTGAMLPHIRRRAAHALLVGVDLAEGMLRMAQSHRSGALLVSDAQRLSIASASIDVALLVFTLFHMPDPAATLRETHRVLRDDGLLGIVTWGRDPGLPGVAIWKEELDREGAAPDPRHPTVMQQAMMDTPQKLRGWIQNSGLELTNLWRAELRHQWDADELLATQAGCGLPARRLPTLDSERQAACAARVRARVAALTPAELMYAAEVLLAVAKRPSRLARRL